MSRRDEAREVLRELLHAALADGNGNGHAEARQPAEGTPPVPAPPVAAVFRPSTWQRPPAPGEVIGDHPPAHREVAVDRPPSAPAPAREDLVGDRPAAHGGEPSSPAPRHATEWVTLDDDADLARFVRSLLARFENPRDRVAITSGRLRFALRRGPATPDATAELRIERGAVTERTIKEAAAAGARVVLGPRAVVTPLAKERARALGIEIEREKPC